MGLHVSTHKRMTRQGVNSTLFDRFLRLQYKIPSIEKARWRRYSESKMKLKYRGKQLNFKPFEVEISSSMKDKLSTIYTDLSSDQRLKNYIEDSDRLLQYLDSCAKCHAHLRGRGKVTSSDIEFIRGEIIPWLENALLDEVSMLSKYPHGVLV